MKCVACGATFDTNVTSVCRICGLPEISYLGDQEEAFRAMKPTIDACRNELLSKLSVGVVSYRWADRNGVLEQSGEEKRVIGAGPELSKGTVWLGEEFARKPEAEEIEIRTFIRLNGTDTERTLRVSNLKEAKLQQVGAEIGIRDGLVYRLALRNGAGERYSDWTPMFD